MAAVVKTGGSYGNHAAAHVFLMTFHRLPSSALESLATVSPPHASNTSQHNKRRYQQCCGLSVSHTHSVAPLAARNSHPLALPPTARVTNSPDVQKPCLMTQSTPGPWCPSLFFERGRELQVRVRQPLSFPSTVLSPRLVRCFVQMMHSPSPCLPQGQSSQREENVNIRLCNVTFNKTQMCFSPSLF